MINKAIHERRELTNQYLSVLQSPDVETFITRRVNADNSMSAWLEKYGDIAPQEINKQIVEMHQS